MGTSRSSRAAAPSRSPGFPPILLVFFPPLSAVRQLRSTETQELYLNFRIGDFGLVSSMAATASTQDSLARVVGTEHYRPPATRVTIDENLDVFALGVILLELLCPFSTRMERHETLAALKRGELQVGFTESLGECGIELAKLILGMISMTEDAKTALLKVKQSIKRHVK